MRDAAERVGLDVGGTSLKAGRASARGAVLAREHWEFPRELSGRERLLGIAEIARELGAEGSVGVGLPGLLDRDAGRITESPNLAWLVDQPLRELLGEAIGIEPARVRLENDANAAALGERWCGAAHTERHALVVTLGTGIGGGLILNGELFLGEGLAGEIGHVNVEPDGPHCGCGSRGCLEVLASATAATRRARERGFDMDGDGALERLAARARAQPGGPEALLFDAIGFDLGRGLAQALMLLDVRAFVIGGGFSAALDLLEPGARRALGRLVFGQRAERVRIARAELGPDAGWIGAASLAFDASPALDEGERR